MMARKRLFILLVITVFITSIFASCTSEPKEASTYTDPEQVINISKNERFFISLISVDRTSGYRWSVYYDTSMLKLIESTVQPNLDNRSEFGDTEWFEFKALKSGVTEINMIYMQWAAEGGARPKDEKVFTVNIQ